MFYSCPIFAVNIQYEYDLTSGKLQAMIEANA